MCGVCCTLKRTNQQTVFLPAKRATQATTTNQMENSNATNCSGYHQMCVEETTQTNERTNCVNALSFRAARICAAPFSSQVLGVWCVCIRSIVIFALELNAMIFPNWTAFFVCFCVFKLRTFKLFPKWQLSFVLNGLNCFCWFFVVISGVDKHFHGKNVPSRDALFVR